MAMYIGYSGEYAQMKAANQKLDLGMASIPQAKDYPTFSTGMRLYGVAVMKSSKNMNTAIAAASSFTSTFSNEVANMIGGLSPAKANVMNGKLDADLVKSTLNARSFYDIDQSQSNELMSKMINDILQGRMLSVDAATNFVSKFERIYSGIK